jgi:hypothetical protein
MEAHAVATWNPFASAREKFDELATRLTSDETVKMAHGDVEALLELEGREILRRMFEAHLASRGLGEVEDVVTGNDGHERGHVRVTSRTLMTLFGAVRVERAGYRNREAPTLFPRDGELNLPQDCYSHGVRRRVATEAAKGSFDAVAEAMASTTGAAVPKRQTEELSVRAAEDFDAFYDTRAVATESQAAKTGDVLVLTFDGKGVVMRPEDLRPATQQAAKERRPRLAKRRCKGEKGAARRMAMVAAVYTIAPFFRTADDVVKEFGPVATLAKERPRPQNKRVWASLLPEGRGFRCV